MNKKDFNEMMKRERRNDRRFFIGYAIVCALIFLYYYFTPIMKSILGLYE